MIFDKYKKNLRVENNFIYSYDTKVAEIVNEDIIVKKYYSRTTSKHINYVAYILKLNVIKNY